jgi:ketosteroid isomerase-like protein
MSSAIQDSIQRTNRTFEQEVVAKRKIDALDLVYTANARILPPGAEMVSGRQNIKQFWRNAIEGLNVQSVKLETIQFEPVGETGFEIGRATLQFAAAGSQPLAVKYVVVWKHEDGAWKWHVDIWNTNA